MAANETPWDQNPGYLAMTTTFVLPGGPTSYAVPRPQGPAPGDVTSFHPGQANWSKDNMTWVMYELSPSAAWKDFARSALPKVKCDHFGQPMLEAWPEPDTKPRELLDFAILPDIIGTRESPLLMEEWRRWDGRIRWHDIIMRMPHPRPSANILNMRATRMRLEYHMLSWHVKAVHDKDNASRDAVLKLLTREQISANTTRGTTPGLVDPNLGVFSASIPHPPEKSASALAKVGWFKTSKSSGKRSSDTSSKQSGKVKKVPAKKVKKVKKVKKSTLMDSPREHKIINTFQEQPMNTFALSQGPYMPYSQDDQIRDTTFYQLELPAHIPYFTTNQFSPQNALSFDLQGHVSAYDYRLFENGLAIQDSVGDQGHANQGPPAEVESTMVLPCSPRHLPTEATEEVIQPQHEVNEELFSTYFDFSGLQNSQVSEDAEAFDGNWLIPEYQRAGFSDFTCQ